MFKRNINFELYNLAMLAELQNTYQSLTPFRIEFPDFTVITGINGSGKTQLLGILGGGGATLKDGNQYFRNLKSVDSYSLRPNTSSLVSKEQLNVPILNVLNEYRRFLDQHKSNPKRKVEDFFDKRYLKIIQVISRRSGRESYNLTEEDFFNHFPLDEGGAYDMFQHNFSNIFKRYNDKLDDNEYKRYRSEQGDKSIKFITTEAFLKEYGQPPWDLINSIFKNANLNFHLNHPHKTNRDTPFELKLTHDLNGVDIGFNQLSSGERIIMSLAFALFNSNYDVDFPEVLLMDEPDASLHPSMIKQFLNVIQNVFVKEKGIKVIITTHSPTTVALSPEESLFIMTKSQPKIKKVSKDVALKELLAGVPSLSVNYENRRQIFVESKIDAIFYEKMCEKNRDNLINEISLNFISSGDKGDGGSSRVKNIVNTLVKYGNKTVFGVIDWDGKNQGNNFIIVLGRNERYSIENYIFDPILVSAFLLREKFISREELGLENNESYVDFKYFESAKLQKIANFIINKIENNPMPIETQMKLARYQNGIEISLPIWFMNYNGHDLEETLKNTFPELKKYNKEQSLKREIISKVIDEMPMLLSIDIINLLRRLQEI